MKTREHIEAVRTALDTLDVNAIETLSSALFETWRNDQAIFVFGNGGSAATATHHVVDFIQASTRESDRGLRAQAIVANGALTTAISNDSGYAMVFREQLAALARPGDMALAISGSGCSPNVVQAAIWARAHGIRVSALTGFDGGRLAPLADIHVHVASTDYGVIEDVHGCLGHILSKNLAALIRAENAAPLRMLHRQRQ